MRRENKVDSNHGQVGGLAGWRSRALPAGKSFTSRTAMPTSDITVQWRAWPNPTRRGFAGRKTRTTGICRGLHVRGVEISFRHTRKGESFAPSHVMALGLGARTRKSLLQSRVRHRRTYQRKRTANGVAKCSLVGGIQSIAMGAAILTVEAQKAAQACLRRQSKNTCTRARSAMRRFGGKGEPRNIAATNALFLTTARCGQGRHL